MCLRHCQCLPLESLMSLFNYELFTINGYPMKFYLDGYTDIQIRETAAIVEAFGGIFSGPGENTIIFSYPGASSSRNCDRFDSKFLFDSVTTGQLANLDYYRLPLAEVCTEIKVEEDCGQSDRGKFAAATPKSTESEEVSEISNSSNDLNKPSSSAVPQASAGEFNCISKSKRSGNDSIDAIPSTSGETLENVTHEKKTRSKSPSREDENHEQKKNSPLRDNENSEGTKSIKRIIDLIPYSKEESLKLLEYISENKTPGVDIWPAMERANIFVNPYRSSGSLRSHYYGKLRGKLRTHLKGECKFGEIAKPAKYTIKAKYSREDDQKIMDYIIKEKLIDNVGSITAWKQIETENILVPPRSWTSLRNHYRDYLRYHLADYIDDPEVIRAFEEGRKRRYLAFLRRSSKY